MDIGSAAHLPRVFMWHAVFGRKSRGKSFWPWWAYTVPLLRYPSSPSLLLAHRRKGPEYHFIRKPIGFGATSRAIHIWQSAQNLWTPCPCPFYCPAAYSFIQTLRKRNLETMPSAAHLSGPAFGIFCGSSSFRWHLGSLPNCSISGLAWTDSAILEDAICPLPLRRISIEHWIWIWRAK